MALEEEHIQACLLVDVQRGRFARTLQRGDGMSILIKDMDIPKSCDKCRFCVNGFTDEAPMYECGVQSYDNVSVLVESGGKPFDFRPDWCPLVEVTE